MFCKELTRPTGMVCEDNYVDLRGIPPFLARSPSALLTVKRAEGR